jgi:hypothetical protein
MAGNQPSRLGLEGQAGNRWFQPSRWSQPLVPSTEQAVGLSAIKIKNHFLKSKLFVSSTCIYTKLMFKFGTILAMFAIFNDFITFYVIFSYISDMNCKCIKSESKVGKKIMFMFIRHLKRPCT